MTDIKVLNEIAIKGAGYLASLGVKRKDIFKIEHLITGKGTLLTFHANIRYDELTQPEQYDYAVPSMDLNSLKNLVHLIRFKMDQLEK